MGTNHPRITSQTLKVLGALISCKDELSGADIARSTGLSSGTLYPILMRLEHHKWIESEWEDGDPRKLERPRRRLYRITAMGARNSRREFDEIAAAIRRPAWGIS
jgi:PadR family transcriptional regulator PadR